MEHLIHAEHREVVVLSDCSFCCTGRMVRCGQDDKEMRLRGRRKPSRGRKPMVDQKKLFDEIFELALQNNMNYLG